MTSLTSHIIDIMVCFLGYLKMYAIDSTSVYFSVLTILASILPPFSLIVVGEGTDKGMGHSLQLSKRRLKVLSNKTSLPNNVFDVACFMLCSYTEWISG